MQLFYPGSEGAVNSDIKHFLSVFQKLKEMY